MQDENRTVVLDAVKASSEKWKAAFNSQDAAGCAAMYEPHAVMHARPFGTFTGREEIAGFWAKLIQDGFADVEYVEPRIEVVDESTALLTSQWRMNQAKGVIHRELWVLGEDGVARLREDDFEALE